jgi:hypothetical protein
MVAGIFWISRTIGSGGLIVNDTVGAVDSPPRPVM